MRSFVGTVSRGIRNRTVAVPWSGPTRGSVLPWAAATGSEREMAAMGTNGTLFAIVTKLAGGTAQASWRLYRERDGRGRIAGEADRKPVDSHLALDVLARPNPHMTGMALFETSQQHLDLTGEAYWLVVEIPGMGVPGQLWPIRPDRITPVPHPTELIAGWVYTGPSGEKVPLRLNEVLQVKYPNPLDAVRGMGPVQAILTDLDAARYTAEWNRSFFENSARPDGAIKVPDSMTDPQFREFQQRWAETHQGMSNAHRVAVLEGGAEWVDMKFSQRDMQFNELRSANDEQVRQAFGFPKSMLGAVDDVNRANAETGEYVFGRWLIEPRLKRWQELLNERYLPLFGTTGEGVVFDFDDPAPPNVEQENATRSSKVQAVVALVNAGFDPEAACESVGLDPIEFVGRATQPAPAPEPEPEEAAA